MIFQTQMHENEPVLNLIENSDNSTIEQINYHIISNTKINIL